mgnify:CR=1 FL=1
MRSRACLFVAAWLLFLAACSHLPERALIPVPPVTLSGGWQRVTLDTPAAGEAPPVLRALKPSQRVRASYRGASITIGVDAYALPSQASAFEAQQQWRKEEGTLGFQSGNLFVVLSSQGAAQDRLIAFSRTLEEEWLGGRR